MKKVLSDVVKHDIDNIMTIHDLMIDHSKHSNKFLEEFKDKVDWDNISQYQIGL